MERLIEFIFDGTFDDIKKRYDYLNEYEENRYNNIDVRVSIECYTDTQYFCFMIIDESSKEIYENILETNNIVYICNDITDDVINNKKEILTFINQQVGEFFHSEYHEFKEEYNLWIYENLSIDLILDRINSSGMETLRDIDYQFLEDNE
jgi:hypothetical protein